MFLNIVFHSRYINWLTKKKSENWSGNAESSYNTASSHGHIFNTSTRLNCICFSNEANLRSNLTKCVEKSRQTDQQRQADKSPFARKKSLFLVNLTDREHSQGQTWGETEQWPWAENKKQNHFSMLSTISWPSNWLNCIFHSIFLQEPMTEIWASAYTVSGNHTHKNGHF